MGRAPRLLAYLIYTENAFALADKYICTSINSSYFFIFQARIKTFIHLLLLRFSMKTLEFITFFFYILAIGIPSFFLIIELILGQLPKSSQIKQPEKRKPCAILIPAHNEESVIENTLEKIKAEVQVEDRILVVADNCSDQTAEIVRNSSVDVIERQSSEKRGKGYALDYGIQYLLSHQAPETIVILDADCEFETGSLDTLVGHSQENDWICQAKYLMCSPDEALIETRVSEFTWFIKNAIRPAGLLKLGLGCHLQGSGMAFPAHIFKEVSIASGNIVEDLELGLVLTQKGYVSKFIPSALVYSFFPVSTQGTKTQRTRWEHGHLDSIINLLPKMLFDSMLAMKWKTFWLVLDAMIPPMIIFLLIIIGCTVVSFVLYWLGFGLLFYFSFLTLCLVFINLISIWFFNGRDIIKPQDLVGIMTFLARKTSIYSSFVTARQKAWVRTDRG